MRELFATEAIDAKFRGIDTDVYALAGLLLRGEDYNTDNARWALANRLQAAFEEWSAEAEEKAQAARDALVEESHDD